MKICFAMTLLAGSLLVGCQSLPQSSAPKPLLTLAEESVPTWITQKPQTQPLWQIFNDPILNDFMQQVIASNHELSVATLTLKKSVLERPQNPTINTQSNFTQGGQFGLDGQSHTSRQLDLSVNASWEIDLWGKLALQQQLKEWEKNALQADQQAVYLAVSTSAIKEYFALIAINQKLSDNQQALAFQQKQLNYAQKQLALGLIATADLLPITQTLNSLKQNALSLQTQKNDSLTTLSLLSHTPINQLPKSLVNRERLPTLPKLPPIDATAITNRPDIIALLWRLSASLQQTNLLQKNQYPTLVLTTGANAQTANLLDLIKVPIINWGIALSLPSLNPTAHQQALQSIQIDEQIARLGYEEAVVKALNDVQSKLQSYQHYQNTRALVQQAKHLAKQQLDYQQKRYKLGLIARKELEQSQESYRQSQSAVIDNEHNQAIALVSLYQAIGGVPKTPK